MRRHLGLGVLVAVSLLGCDGPVGDYVAASAVSRDGFARNAEAMRATEGREIRLWGYVDHANLYGDAGARQILAELWSGDGPDAATWRFDLKVREDDPAGRSFAVHVPNDVGRDEVLGAFVAHARAHRPTRVFLTGRLLTFPAPTNTRALTGLRMELRSSKDIRLRPPETH